MILPIILMLNFQLFILILLQYYAVQYYSWKSGTIFVKKKEKNIAIVIIYIYINFQREKSWNIWKDKLPFDEALSSIYKYPWLDKKFLGYCVSFLLWLKKCVSEVSSESRSFTRSFFLDFPYLPLKPYRKGVVFLPYSLQREWFISSTPETRKIKRSFKTRYF